MNVENRPQQFFNQFDYSQGADASDVNKPEQRGNPLPSPNWREWQTFDDKTDSPAQFFRRYEYLWMSITKQDDIVKTIVMGFVEVLDPEFYAEYATTIREGEARREASQRYYEENGDPIFGGWDAIGVVHDGNIMGVMLAEVKLEQCTLELLQAGKIPPIDALYEEADRIAHIYGGPRENNRYGEIRHYLEAHLPETDMPRKFDSFNL